MSDGSLADRVALVTGASRGIGRGVARRLGREGLRDGAEPPQGGCVRGQLVAPSTAISTPRADRYITEGYPTEPVEYLAEVVYEMCHLPATERTGLLAHSLHYARHLELDCRTFDGGTPLPIPQIREYAHPEVFAAGE